MEYKIFFPENTTEDQQDIAAAELGEAGFESFSQQGNIMCAYIPQDEYLRYAEQAQEYLKEAGYVYEVSEIRDDVNWNAEWESNFEPIVVGDRCLVRAPFHESHSGMQHEIVIMPKMSFGTGHHSTTYLMLESILDADVAGKTGLDMGAGTGVLAILAAMRGAAAVDAVDIDEWAYENCIENIAVNSVSDRVRPLLGDSSLLNKPEAYDFIFANINRNILLADMKNYAASLKTGGTILFSGFLGVDVPAIEAKAAEEGLSVEHTAARDGWCLIVCTK